MSDIKNNCYVICFKYYSLPEFPENCHFLFNSDLFLRDLFGCTSNERHYEYPKFQDFTYDIGCNEKGVIRAIEQFNSKNEVFILFRTGHTRVHSLPKKQYIVGYYKLARAYKITTAILGKNKDFLGFEADEVVFLSKANAIETPDSFPKRGPIDIFSTNGKYREYLQDTLKDLRKKRESKLNEKDSYKKQTKSRVFNLIKKGYRDQLFEYCQNECTVQDCFLKISLRRNFQRNQDNYLDYLYSPHVFYSHYIKRLKANKRMVYI